MLLFPSIYACTLLLYSFSQSCWYVWLAVAGKSLELTHNMHNTCAQTTTEGERILYEIRGIMELNDAHGIGNLRFFLLCCFFSLFRAIWIMQTGWIWIKRLWASGAYFLLAHGIRVWAVCECVKQPFSLWVLQHCTHAHTHTAWVINADRTTIWWIHIFPVNVRISVPMEISLSIAAVPKRWKKNLLFVKR